MLDLYFDPTALGIDKSYCDSFRNESTGCMINVMNHERLKDFNSIIVMNYKDGQLYPFAYACKYTIGEDANGETIYIIENDQFPATVKEFPKLYVYTDDIFIDDEEVEYTIMDADAPFDKEHNIVKDIIESMWLK